MTLTVTLLWCPWLWREGRASPCVQHPLWCARECVQAPEEIALSPTFCLSPEALLVALHRWAPSCLLPAGLDVPSAGVQGGVVSQAGLTAGSPEEAGQGWHRASDPALPDFCCLRAGFHPVPHLQASCLCSRQGGILCPVSQNWVMWLGVREGSEVS